MQSSGNWAYTGPDVPAPGPAHACISLWLYRNRSPSKGREAEVIIRDFSLSSEASRTT